MPLRIRVGHIEADDYGIPQIRRISPHPASLAEVERGNVSLKHV